MRRRGGSDGWRIGGGREKKEARVREEEAMGSMAALNDNVAAIATRAGEGGAQTQTQRALLLPPLSPLLSSDSFFFFFFSFFFFF